MRDYVSDIVIVGGGIAGLAVARAVCGNSGLKVVLVESKGIGSNNPSPLTFADIIEEYDLSDCTKAVYSRFLFHNYRGSSVTYVFKDCPLVILDYKKACDKLFKSICGEKETVKFINAEAVEFIHDANSVIVKLKDESRVKAKILIDCSGKSKFAVPQSEKDTIAYYSHVYGAFFSSVKNDRDNWGGFLWPAKEFGSGGGWFYSLKGVKASFGYANISTLPQADHVKLENNFRIALKNFPPYSDYLKDALMESVETGTIPITHCKKFVYGNIMIVGDSAGMATNWTCMGIEPALKYGKLAGELAVKAVRENDNVQLNKFQDIWDKENKLTYDLVAEHGAKLWDCNSSYREWRMKIDMAFLSPAQILGRMRHNSYLPDINLIRLRALNYKIKCFINKNNLQPKEFIIKK